MPRPSLFFAKNARPCLNKTYSNGAEAWIYSAQSYQSHNH
jgi:hypothetical protein